MKVIDTKEIGLTIKKKEKEYLIKNFIKTFYFFLIFLKTIKEIYFL